MMHTPTRHIRTSARLFAAVYLFAIMPMRGIGGRADAPDWLWKAGK